MAGENDAAGAQIATINYLLQALWISVLHSQHVTPSDIPELADMLSQQIEGRDLSSLPPEVQEDAQFAQAAIANNIHTFFAEVRNRFEEGLRQQDRR